MIVVTGGAGFIGSNLINFLGNRTGQKIISVDWKNDENSRYFNIKNLKRVSKQQKPMHPKKTRHSWDD